jgi:negative regulator of flagellin synthesis FlgM
MKIGSRIVDAYMKTSVVGPTSPARESQGTASTAAASPSDAAEVSISEEARALMAGASAPVDHSKIESLKTQIAEGTFKVDAHAVAARLVDKLA